MKTKLTQIKELAVLTFTAAGISYMSMTLASYAIKSCAQGAPSYTNVQSIQSKYDPHVEWKDNFDSVYYWNGCKHYTTKTN